MCALKLCITPPHKNAIYRYLERGDKKQVLDLLRSDEPLPQDFRIFLADLIEGKINKKVGRPRKSTFKKAIEMGIINPDIREEYQKLIVDFRKNKDNTGTPKERAIAFLADEYGMSESKISQIIYPRKNRVKNRR